MTGYKIPHFGLKKQYNNIREELLSATDEVLREGCLVGGSFTRKFEDWLKNRCGTWHAVTVHSGTQALEIMAKYHISKYAMLNKVCIPNLTYPATLNAFLNSGYEVTILDTDSNGIIVIPEHFIEDIVCVVGLYGAKPNNKLLSVTQFIDGAQHWLVEDDTGTGMAISFDPTKNLPSSGNGGAIVTDNQDLHDFALNYRDNSKLTNHVYTGSNSKMSEIECAHLLVRSKYIDIWQDRRKQIREYYIDRFENIPVRCLSKGFKKHADQKFVIALEDRDALYGYLLQNGIEAKIHYKQPLSELPVAKDLVKPDMLSVSVHLARMVCSLPIYPELSDYEVEIIADKVVNFFDK